MLSFRRRRTGRRGLRVLLVTIFLVAVGAACSDVRPVAKVDFDSPDIARTGESPGAVAPADVVRIALAGVTSPEATATTYADLIAYLEERLERPVDVVQKRTYAEINALLEEGTVQAAFVCSLAYVLAKDSFGVELLVAPEVDGSTEYFSYLIVPAASRGQNLADLEGGVFAFTDPLSNSGHLVPVHELNRRGETPENFFERTLFTDSHDNSVRSVMAGLVDGAAVDSLVYDGLVADDPGLRQRVRVIERWGPFGIPPLVVPATVDPALRRSLKDVFMSMTDDEDGVEILAQLRIDRFVTVDDSMYDGIRAMWRDIGGHL